VPLALCRLIDAVCAALSSHTVQMDAHAVFATMRTMEHDLFTHILATLRCACCVHVV
jgi:aspartate/glutamate racemase